jgi:hypothetical protein
LVPNPRYRQARLVTALHNHFPRLPDMQPQISSPRERRGTGHQREDRTYKEGNMPPEGGPYIQEEEQATRGRTACTRRGTGHQREDRTYR